MECHDPDRRFMAGIGGKNHGADLHGMLDETFRGDALRVPVTSCSVIFVNQAWTPEISQNILGHAAGLIFVHAAGDTSFGSSLGA
jgi:hypothetical protein